MAAETTIACDESGAEGENLTGSTDRVFVHASVAIGPEDARAAMEELRWLAPSQAPEFKARQLMQPARRPALLWLLGERGPLAGQASVYLVDKDYFVVAKVVDLLVEELAHARGEDLYSERQARSMAWALHAEGRRALGTDAWNRLLSSFNSLMRTKQRSGDKTTVDAFFAQVDAVRLRSTRRQVSDVLDLVWQARPHADEFQQMLAEDPATLPALDPLVASIAQTARSWAERTGRPLTIVHDEHPMLTPARVQDLIGGLARPHRDFRHLAPPVRVTSIEQVRSHEDDRVMLADLLAGAARAIATGALLGRADAELAELLRPYVDEWSLWSHAPSWRLLTGRQRPGA